MFIGVRVYECVRVSGVCGVCLRVWLFMCIYVCVRFAWICVWRSGRMSN